MDEILRALHEGRAILVIIAFYAFLGWSSGEGAMRGLAVFFGMLLVSGALYGIILAIAVPLGWIHERLMVWGIAAFGGLLTWVLYKAGLFTRREVGDVQEGPGGSHEWMDDGEAS